MNKGIVTGIITYILWGLFPIYWRAIESVPAIQILGHRMVWSLVFVAIVLALRKDWRWLGPALRDRRTLATYTLAAVLLSVNWFTYIWGVNAGYIVETSLGYFINPLVSMLLGVLFLGERLRRGQVLAVGLAVIGVLYLTVNYGRLPWIALVLAFTFGLYGLIKKTAPLGSLQGFTLETIAMFFPALIYLSFVQINGSAAFINQGAFVTTMLVMAGAVTSIPLLLFGIAARRIPLSMIGFLQYIAPTLQFLLGVLVYKDPFPPKRLLGFVIIWAALAVYSLEGLWVNWRTPARPATSEGRE